MVPRAASQKPLQYLISNAPLLLGTAQLVADVSMLHSLDHRPSSFTASPLKHFGRRSFSVGSSIDRGGQHQASYPTRIILVRHAESMDLDRLQTEGRRIPNHLIPLSPQGETEAVEAGHRLDELLRGLCPDYRLHIWCSPFVRTLRTATLMFGPLRHTRVVGYQEEVLLREQDYGNFHGPQELSAVKRERLEYSRFYYRFPSGESSADVYGRMTVLQDHLVRDVREGRFEGPDNLVMVTHGLALRVFLMRWMHWTVDEFLAVYNPPGATPIILERCGQQQQQQQQWSEAVPVGHNGSPSSWSSQPPSSWPSQPPSSPSSLSASTFPHAQPPSYKPARPSSHIKAMYRLLPASQLLLPGVTDAMCTSKVNGQLPE